MIKRLLSTVAALALCSVPALAYDVYPGCATPGAGSGMMPKSWWVDAVNGKSPTDGGDGSFEKPWNSLNGAISGAWAKGRTPFPGYSRPLLSSVPYQHIVDGKWQTIADSVGAPPVNPGDTINLMTGAYGDLELGAYLTPTVNSQFVIVQAAPGQVPRFDTMLMTATKKWVFDGVRVQSPLGTNGNTRNLITITDQGANLQTSDLIFTHALIRSLDSVTGMTQAQLTAQLRYAINIRSGTGDSTNGAPYTTCLSITNSRISNTRTAIILFGNKSLFDNNEVDHFFDDGIIYAASDVQISRNYVHDGGDIGDGNHEDAMQGQAGFAPAGLFNKFSNILIDSNRVIRQTDPQMPFPTYMQGISNFDADWTNWRAINNIVVTSACWGIWSGSAHQSLIANNTVAEDGLIEMPNCHPLVTIGGKTHQGRDADTSGVFNNIAPQVSIDNKAKPTISWGNNLSFTNLVNYDAAGNAVWNNKKGFDAWGNLATAAQPAAMFRLWDPARLLFDVTPQMNAPAIGIGTANGVPATDIAGRARVAPLTPGAYGAPF